MTTKQAPGRYSLDGSKYGTTTDGVGALAPLATHSSGSPKQNTGSQAPDGSIYFCITDGANTLT